MSCEPRSGSTKSLTRLDQSTLIFVTLMILPLIQKIQKEMRPSFLTKTTSANLPAKLEPLFDHMYENLAATRLSQGRTSWTRSPSAPTEWETSFCDLESATCEILKNFCFNKIFNILRKSVFLFFMKLRLDVLRIWFLIMFNWNLTRFECIKGEIQEADKLLFWEENHKWACTPLVVRSSSRGSGVIGRRLACWPVTPSARHLVSRHHSVLVYMQSHRFFCKHSNSLFLNYFKQHEARRHPRRRRLRRKGQGVSSQRVWFRFIVVKYLRLYLINEIFIFFL